MKREKKEQALQVRFPLEVWQAVKRLAQDENRSFNGEVIWILGTHITARKGKDTRETGV